MLRPIPTEVNGICFKSKLEAQWASFMDEEGISYVYEPEQVDLGWTRVTPDFWVPWGEMDYYGVNRKRGIYLEIKGPRPTELDLKIARSLAETAQHSVYVIHGSAQYGIKEWWKYGVRWSLEIGDLKWPLKVIELYYGPNDLEASQRLCPWRDHEIMACHWKGEQGHYDI